MHIILLGPPGSGKGTVADKLERALHYTHISAGAMLREEVAKGTRLGKDIQKYLESGKLVPDELVTDIVKLEAQGKKHFVLDGFPRSLGQAKAIADLHINNVILLDIAEKVVIERFAGRRICTSAGHGYHLKFLPPKKSGKCDIDGSKLVRRKDDRPSVIRDRFRIYRRQTLPVVRYFRQRGMLVKVNADQAPKKVYGGVRAVLRR